MAGNKITAVRRSDNVMCEWQATGAVTVSADGKSKSFNGHRVKPPPAETTDGAMTIQEDALVDQKVEAT